SNGASPSSLPRWRQFLSMLNWRRDPDYEQRKMQHELYMQQLEKDILQVRSDRERLEKDILRVRSDRERIKSEIEPIKNDCEQIEKEIEQLRRENAKLAKLNARDDALSALIKQHCFPDDSNSTPAPLTEPDSVPSSP
ncbi:MAG: hypothetical protein ACKOXO_13105, partial [Cyanobium sp.]